MSMGWKLSKEDRYEKAKSLAELLFRTHQRKERHNGYTLIHPNGATFGYIRFNEHGDYIVYAFAPFNDSKKKFSRTSEAADYNYSFSPEDTSAIAYAIKVLRSSYDLK